MEIALTHPTDESDPDVDLLSGVARGEEDALTALYVRHGRRLFAYACRLTGDAGRAEEVLQESLVAAWKGARGFRGEARVSTWLLGIVRRQALMATRRKALPTAELAAAEEAADDSLCPEDVAELGDRRRVLRAALIRLSPSHREALELVFYHGLSLAETAEIFGCPVGTVKSRLSYAKAQLRRALEESGLRAEDLI
jgi:RNA polymerase sigma factor (sigma-70 family)